MRQVVFVCGDLQAAFACSSIAATCRCYYFVCCEAVANEAPAPARSVRHDGCDPDTEAVSVNGLAAAVESSEVAVAWLTANRGRGFSKDFKCAGHFVSVAHGSNALGMSPWWK